MKLWRFGDDSGPLRELLDRGGILAIPTESSYGLAADPRNPLGVETIFAVKGRNDDKALPVVVASVSQLAALGVAAGAPGLAAAAALWPAALSVVLPCGPLPAARGAGSLAVRIPAHDGLRALLAELGPLTATSANRSGAPPLLESAEVAELLAGHDAVVVDGGRLPGGPPSTMVEWKEAGWHILRTGRYQLAPSHPRTPDSPGISAGPVEKSVEIEAASQREPRTERNA